MPVGISKNSAENQRPAGPRSADIAGRHRHGVGRGKGSRCCWAAPNMSSAISAVTPIAWPQQSPPHRFRRRARQLPLARLCPRRQAPRHDPRRRGSCAAPRAAKRLRAHPPLRPAVEPLPQTLAALARTLARLSRTVYTACGEARKPPSLPSRNHMTAHRYLFCSPVSINGKNTALKITPPTSKRY